MKINKNVSHRKWMFGDFDKDGVANIDDPKPLDPKIKKWDKPSPNKTSFGDNEVKLSNELKAIERHNNSYAPFLVQFMRNNNVKIGRVKSVPSTIKKLRERHIDKIKDLIGAMMVTKNRKEAFRRSRDIERRYRTDPKEKDDYYRNPLGDVHYGIHQGLLFGKNNKRMELQIKSKPMFEHDKKIHPYYKSNKSLKRFIKKGKELYRKGY